MIISLDTETTGVDLAHGALPFLVTTCCEDGIIRFWEWDVDPLTRRPEIPPDDLVGIAALIDAADTIYLQNAKFDHRALAAVGVDLPWSKVRDTLIASHLLASNHPHDLTSLCIEYLGTDIEQHELKVKEVTQTCRAIAKRDYPHWRIASEGAPSMPSVTAGSKRGEDKPWKNDMWLPRALARHQKIHNQDWLTACQRYANADSEHTLPLGLELERLIRERGYWSIYLHRLRLPEVYGAMEMCGVTGRASYTDATITEYEAHVAEAECTMRDIAAEFGHDLQLAEGASLNDNMRDFFYGAVEQRCPRCDYTKRIKHWNGEGQADWLPVPTCPKCIKPSRGRAGVKHVMTEKRRPNLALPVIPNKKTGNASLDSAAMEEYIQTLDDGPALDFMGLLLDKRRYDTALAYMRAYRRFGIPVAGAPGYYRVHPSLNPCGTDHLRASSNSPNMQNVSGESKELSNRACFGPLIDREWWNMDFRSIERRIPPYECGEPEMVKVFEQADQPPYWGSLYYLTASVLYPDEFWPRSRVPPDHKESFKKACPKLYKQAKFFDLAKQYGAGRKKGDLLSRVHNSYDKVDSSFPLLAALQQKYLHAAERNGFVETLPDRTVDPTRGYPILASRTEDGRVLSTTPFNYHVSGTACDIKNKALVRCHDQCAAWRAEGFDARIALEVHDSILFDFPRGRNMEENLPRALVLRTLMEGVGQDMVPPIPTPVSCEYHIESWADGVAVK